MVKVITYGTYDLFHKGHYNILKRAKEQGDYLIVGVTGEIYDLERGKLNVQDSLLTRIENVRKTGFADKIIVEEYMGQKISDVVKYGIDKLVIGSDWKGKFDYLNRYCEVVYLDRTKDISSTQLRNQQKIYQVGIITDTLDDGQIVYESKYVSGIHVESVFAKDEQLASEFAAKYELAKTETDFESFVSSVDVVYVRTDLEDRYQYCKNVIEHKKHLICEAPATMALEEYQELNRLADENGVLILDNVILAYLRAMAQLTWMLNRELIGEVIKIRCSVRCDSPNKYGMIDQLTDALLVFLRIFESDCTGIDMVPIKDRNGDIIFNQIIMKFGNQVGVVEMGSSLSVNESMEIIGTKGRVHLPNEWWNMGYFETSEGDDQKLKRYSFNFEGNGMRYMIHEFLIMMKQGMDAAKKLQPEEMCKMIGIQQQLLQMLND